MYTKYAGNYDGIWWWHDTTSHYSQSHHTFIGHKLGILSIPSPGLTGKLTVRVWQNSKINVNLKGSFNWNPLPEIGSKYANFYGIGDNFIYLSPLRGIAEINIGFNLFKPEKAKIRSLKQDETIKNLKVKRRAYWERWKNESKKYQSQNY